VKEHTYASNFRHFQLLFQANERGGTVACSGGSRRISRNKQLANVRRMNLDANQLIRFLHRRSSHLHLSRRLILGRTCVGVLLLSTLADRPKGRLPWSVIDVPPSAAMSPRPCMVDLPSSDAGWHPPQTELVNYQRRNGLR
jgi:hypothetical protein